MTVPIQPVARQGSATARTREHPTGGAIGRSGAFRVLGARERSPTDGTVDKPKTGVANRPADFAALDRLFVKENRLPC
jgi:hypothetical protein